MLVSMPMPMPPNGTDDGMEMMSMEMVMTFSDWDAYQLKLLFRSWDIEEKWQFALSWFAVVFAVIFYHWMKCIYRKLSNLLQTTHTTEVPLLNSSHTVSYPRQIVLIEDALTVTYFQLTIIRAFWNALIYGMALMLMLVAMTYNSSLFVALLIGYFIGDAIFQELPNDICNRQHGNNIDHKNIESCH